MCHICAIMGSRGGVLHRTLLRVPGQLGAASSWHAAGPLPRSSAAALGAPCAPGALGGIAVGLQHTPQTCGPGPEPEPEPGRVPGRARARAPARAYTTEPVGACVWCTCHCVAVGAPRTAASRQTLRDANTVEAAVVPWTSREHPVHHDGTWHVYHYDRHFARACAGLARSVKAVWQCLAGLGGALHQAMVLPVALAQFPLLVQQQLA